RPPSVAIRSRTAVTIATDCRSGPSKNEAASGTVSFNFSSWRKGGLCQKDIGIRDRFGFSVKIV
ncbi:unnamed protein product, partial [Callosobruchus maculatus]